MMLSQSTFTVPWLEVVTLAASFSSIVLAIVAIVLSFKFFKMSSQASDDIKDKAGEIAKIVGELNVDQKILHTQTFGQLEEVLARFFELAMAPRGGEDREAFQANVEAKFEDLKSGLFQRVDDAEKLARSASSSSSSFKAEVKKIVEEAITETRTIETSSLWEELWEGEKEILCIIGNREKNILPADCLPSADTEAARNYLVRLTRLMHVHKLIKVVVNKLDDKVTGVTLSVKGKQLLRDRGLLPQET